MSLLQQQQQRAGPATDVEHALARLDRREIEEAIAQLPLAEQQPQHRVVERQQEVVAGGGDVALVAMSGVTVASRNSPRAREVRGEYARSGRARRVDRIVASSCRTTDMAVALDRPFPKQPSAAERAMLRLLQGNILKAHGRSATAHVFLRFDSARSEAARAFLRALAPTLTSASAQDEQSRSRGARPAFRSCCLSYVGYVALGVAPDATPGCDAFRAGMKVRGAQLGDPPPETWDNPFAGDVHAMVLIGGDPDAGDPAASAQVDAELKALTAMLPYAVRVLGVERGRLYRNADGNTIEHFGFVDGRSRPLLREIDVEKELANGGNAHWDPAFPMRQVLSFDPGAREPNAFGSYLVFRKLEQNVRDFLDAEENLAATLQKLNPHFDPALAGAMLVGRFRDGTPVLLQVARRRAADPERLRLRGRHGTARSAPSMPTSAR